MRLVFGGAMCLALFLTGCGESSAPETTAKPAQTEQPAPATTEQKPEATAGTGALAGKTFSVVTTGTAAPFSLRDERGVLTGIDIEIIEAIAASGGFKIEFYEQPWQKILPAIENGDYDIAMNGINYSDERNEKYGLTNPYVYNPSALMYKKDAEVKPTKLEELSGLTIAVMKDAKQDGEVTPVPKTTIVRESNLYMAYKALVQGGVNVVAYDMAVMQSLVKEHNDQTVTIVPYEDKSNKATYNIFVVNKKNTELQQALNDGLDKLKANGKLDEITKKYLGESQ